MNAAFCSMGIETRELVIEVRVSPFLPSLIRVRVTRRVGEKWLGDKDIGNLE
jgi:hypothetical protein